MTRFRMEVRLFMAGKLPIQYTINQ